MALILGVPAVVNDLNQKGLLERAFHDGLYPNLAFRYEALPEKWDSNSGTELFQSRPGMLAPIVEANVPGTDPTPQVIPFEQWSVTISQYSGSVDVHMPTSVTSNSDLFLRSIHQLGLQAGQSLNRVARNAMAKSYLSGRTNLIAAALSTDTSIRVASLNGFTDVIAPGVNTRPQNVSPAFMLPVVIGVTGSTITRNVIAATPDDPTDPFGPGSLLLSAAIGGSGYADRSPVVSIYAPKQSFPAGGQTIDSIGASDVLNLQQCFNAVAILREANVQTHADGYYHAHISPTAQAQLFSGSDFKQLHTALPEGLTYARGFLGEIGGILFFMNTESPNKVNCGVRTATSQSAQYSRDIGAETTNKNGVDIGRVIMTGKGMVYEKYLDESQYISEAGVTGKVGEFQVVNNGIDILTERVRLILRAPLNRLQDKVSLTWTSTTGFPIPSDVTAPSGIERFKRGIVLNHAV